MIYGRGLDATDSDVKPEMYAKMKLLLKPKGLKEWLTITRCLGQAAMQIIYNKLKTSYSKSTTLSYGDIES